jgi:ATP-dependent DNA helicase DinG
MPDPAHNEFCANASVEIENILKITGGKAFALFTSYRNMQMVYKQVSGKLPYRLLLQGEAPKPVLIKEFMEDTDSVLFATISFWQGVDVPGRALSCVIIDKLPFQSPGDPLIEAKIDTIKKNGGSPFTEYQLPSAVLLLKQGLGRLIRSSSDKGVMAVLDKRIRTKGYGKTFMRALPELETVGKIDDLKKTAAKLFD